MYDAYNNNQSHRPQLEEEKKQPGHSKNRGGDSDGDSYCDFNSMDLEEEASADLSSKLAPSKTDFMNHTEL